MFQCVFFLGLLALGYSGPVVPESNTINYLDLIDAVESTPVGPLDKQCAKRFKLVLNDFKDTSKDYIITYRSESTLATRKQDYSVCLALKRGLVDEYGNVNENHKNNWVRDLRSLGLFDERLIDAVKTYRPSTSDLENEYPDGAFYGYENYIDGLYDKLREFYGRMENSNSNSNSKETVAKSENDIVAFSPEASARVMKAVMKFQYMSPKV